jgi:hypothetical protein
MIISKYHNLDLEAFGYQKAADGTERFHVRVEDAPRGVGGQKRDEAKKVTVPPDLRKRARQLERRLLKKSDMIDLGEKLANLLFPTEEARRLLTRSWERIPEDEGLRVRLKLETYALADLPWEYTYLSFPPKGFVAHNRRISLVRYEVMEQPRQCKLDPVTPGPVRVVILSANPVGPGYRALDLTGEVQRIADAMKEEVGIDVVHYPDATLEELEEALKHAAHVFHFAGHGRFEGDLGMAFGSQEGKVFIVLLGENRQEHLFPANTLKVKLADRGVRLVVLNACESGRRGQRDQLNEWTGITPALIEAGIPAVLGMQYSIKDHLAKEFSKEFYSALAAGYSIDAAVAEGRQAIFVRTREEEPDWRDWGVPVLYLHLSAGEGVLFPQVGGTRGPDTGETPPATLTGEPQPGDGVRISVLRELVNAALGDEELANFCFDYYPAVYEKFAAGQTRSARVRMLVEHAQRQNLIRELLQRIQERNPSQYASFKSRLTKP